MDETSPPVPGRKKLVVVEDDEDTRELELFLLGSEGYHVVGLADGEHAAETILREHADLVILDVMLPRKDGVEVLRELAASPETANTPVILVSAYLESPAVQKALATSRQVKRVFQKPFDVTQLFEAVSEELASAEEEDPS